MRIGIDARELCGHATGVGRYLGGLLREWGSSDQARRHEFVLYAHEAPPILLDSRRFPTHLVEGSGGTWWEQRQLPAAAAGDHLDLFFAPAYTAPLLHRTPTVVAIHDVSFAAHPEWFTAREGARRRFFSRRAALQARAVITISRFSERELVEWFGIPSSRIHVIPPGVTRLPTTPGPPARAALLYVGSIFNRRHVPELVRAFAAVASVHPEASLDLVGDNRSFPHEDLKQLIARGSFPERVRWREWVDDEELARLYGGARAFAFLSEYEGLGLTPLEALAAGVPPVVLDTAVSRESCGDAAVYVPNLGTAAIARALERALFDDDERRRILAAAPAVLSRFDWQRAAADTLSALEAAA